MKKNSSEFELFAIIIFILFIIVWAWPHIVKLFGG